MRIALVKWYNARASLFFSCLYSCPYSSLGFCSYARGAFAWDPSSCYTLKSRSQFENQCSPHSSQGGIGHNMEWENHRKEKFFFVCAKILTKTKGCCNWAENLFPELGYLISREGLTMLLCSLPPPFFLSCFLSIKTFVISLVPSFLVLEIWICIFVCTISRVWLIHKMSTTECKKLSRRGCKNCSKKMRTLAITYLFWAFGIPNGPIKNMNIMSLFAAQEVPLQGV